MASEKNSNASDKVIYEEIIEIYEEEEEGFSSTVHHTDIIYDHVKLECEDCIQESVGLNYKENKKENKKESSFNASEPRKSKIKYKKDFLQLTNKKENSDSTQGLYKYKKKKDTKESNCMEVNNAVDRKFIKENVDLIKKKSLITPALSRKKKETSYFNNENNHPTEADEEGSIILLSDTENSDKEDNSIISIDDSSCSSSDECTENEIASGKKFSDLDNIFKGDMFLVKDPILGIALNKGTPVYYCLQENYIQAENATSATMAARRLLDGVFTVKALSICSLPGISPRGRAKSAYTDKSSIKPYLCPKALNVIIEKTLQFQKMNPWYPRKGPNHIRNAMALRINEIAAFPGRKQIRWTQEEKETALCAFSEYMEELKLPSSKDIELIKKEYASLDKRTWPQIKTWLHKQQQKETLRRQQLY